MSQTKTVKKWTLASVELRDGYTDFMLSRQAMNAPLTTLDFYKYTAGKFLEWIEARDITSPIEVTAHCVREYTAKLTDNGKQDSTVWGHARAIKTMLLFWYKEYKRPSSLIYPVKQKKRLPM